MHCLYPPPYKNVYNSCLCFISTQHIDCGVSVCGEYHTLTRAEYPDCAASPSPGPARRSAGSGRRLINGSNQTVISSRVSLRRCAPLFAALSPELLLQLYSALGGGVGRNEEVYGFRSRIGNELSVIGWRLLRRQKTH